MNNMVLFYVVLIHINGSILYISFYILMLSLNITFLHHIIILYVIVLFVLQ